MTEEIKDIYETKYPTEEQKKKYIRTENETNKDRRDNFKSKYARSDIIEKIMERKKVMMV